MSISIDDDNVFFVDNIRIAAISPVCSQLRKTGTAMTDKKLFWRGIAHLWNYYAYLTRELSRYDDDKYHIPYIFQSPRYQNNVNVFMYEAASLCVREIINSYRSLSLFPLYDYYYRSLQLSKVECGIDFF